MNRSLKPYALLCYRAGHNFVENFGFEMAGYLTFLQLLAVFPYTVLMASVAGLFGQGETGSRMISALMAHLPADAVATISPRIEEILNGPPQSILTFSILGAIWTSSSAIEGVRGMLNRSYQVRKPPAYLARRLTSIGQIFLLTLAILSIMVMFVLTPIVIKSFTHYTGIALPLTLANFFTLFFKPIAAMALFGIIACFYHVLPNIKQSWMAVAPGALLVVILWGSAAGLVSFYLKDISQMTMIYGSLSGFIATLIFFYVMNIIFIYGADFNHELLVLHGERIVEKEVPKDITVH